MNGTADTLALDVKLAVDGTMNEAGVLVADRIVFRLPSLVEIEADIEKDFQEGYMGIKQLPKDARWILISKTIICLSFQFQRA